MRLPLLTAVAATIALVAAGCSSSGPDVPGSGLHQSGSSGGSPGASGSGGSGSSGGTSSGPSGSGSSSGAGSMSSGGGSNGGSSSGGSTITANATWTDGETLPGSVTIAAGATVTINPGAAVNVPAGATITVEGTLTASSATPTHAKLTGSGWGGVVVASGGTMTLDGVDLLGGTSKALDVQKGATKAEYDDGTIDSATAPFTVEAGGALTTRHATVTKALGSSSVTGSFTAQHLDYDSNGHEGITTLDPSATLSIDDSTLHGSGPVADFLVSSGAATFHVGYTNIKDVHCGFHFNSITAFDISYTNVESNAYGFMLYGSGGAGPRTISYSNIDQNNVAYDTLGNNGPITVDHCYVTGMVQNGTAVSVTNQQNAAIAGTGPRAN